jgi:DNA-binding response OmpR family regulator
MTLIVIIEDNLAFGAGLRCNLEAEGFEVQVAATVTDGLRKIHELSPVLVIRDVVLHDEDGSDVLVAMKRDRIAVPIVVLSARADEQSKLRCYTLGVDEYITKPVSIGELLARVHAVLRRTSADSITRNAWIRIGEIAIHPPTRSVKRGGGSVALRPKEYDLLLTLLRHRGCIVSREDLLRDVWKRDAGKTTRTVDNHVLGLRRKLESDPRCPVYIVTAHSAGYMLRR